MRKRNELSVIWSTKPYVQLYKYELWTDARVLDAEWNIVISIRTLSSSIEIPPFTRIDMNYFQLSKTNCVRMSSYFCLWLRNGKISFFYMDSIFC